MATTVLISFLTPLATDGISYAYGYVFAGCNLAAAIIVWFFLYESVSLSLENVDRMYSQPDVKPWSSSKWLPPGYVTRKQRDGGHFRALDGGLGSPEEKDHPLEGPVESRQERV